MYYLIRCITFTITDFRVYHTSFTGSLFTARVHGICPLCSIGYNDVEIKGKGEKQVPGTSNYQPNCIILQIGSLSYFHFQICPRTLRAVNSQMCDCWQPKGHPQQSDSQSRWLSIQQPIVFKIGYIAPGTGTGVNWTKAAICVEILLYNQVLLL